MIIFLYGPDTFRSRQKLQAIKEKFINEVDKSTLNIQTFDGRKMELIDFRQAISTPPFLAKKRMIIVDGLLSRPKGQKIQAEVLEAINNIKPEDVAIVFWEGAIKKSGKLSSKLVKEKFAQEFKELSPAEVKTFINHKISQQNKTIDPTATQLLADIVGNDLWRLSSEIQKLLAYAKDKITSNDVTNLVNTKLEDDIFKLTDALGHKNNSLALKLIDDQLKNGTSAIELLAKIIWQYKNLLLVKTFTVENGGGYQNSGIGYQLGLHPFVVKKTQSQIKNFELQDLQQTYLSLLKIDQKLKTSQLNPQVLFDLLVVKQ